MTEDSAPGIDDMMVRFVTLVEESLDRHATRMEKVAVSLIAAIQGAGISAPPQPAPTRAPARTGAPTPPQARGTAPSGGTGVRSAYCACECQCWREYGTGHTGQCCSCIIENRGTTGPCGCQSQGGEALIKGRYWEWHAGQPAPAPATPAEPAPEPIDPDDLPF